MDFLALVLYFQFLILPFIYLVKKLIFGIESLIEISKIFAERIFTETVIKVFSRVLRFLTSLVHIHLLEII